MAVVQPGCQDVPQACARAGAARVRARTFYADQFRRDELGTAWGACRGDVWGLGCCGSRRGGGGLGSGRTGRLRWSGGGARRARVNPVARGGCGGRASRFQSGRW